MKPFTPKRQARNAEAKSFRLALAHRVKRCELCGRPQWPIAVFSESFVVHEIARGPFRAAAMDKAFAVLAICRECHEQRLHGNEKWSEARQLARIKECRPKDYDLVAYNHMINPAAPDRITEEEIINAGKEDMADA